MVISLEELNNQTDTPEDYKLIGAEQIYLEGKFIWRMTFKPRYLLPEDPSTEIIGCGGEIFVNVDLKTGERTVGYGE